MSSEGGRALRKPIKNGEKNVEKHKDMTSENDNKQVMIKKTADAIPAFDKREKGNKEK